VRRRTDGVPLFVAQLAQSWLDAGVLRASEGRWELARPGGAEPELPDDLRRLIELQLERLDPADMTMLEAAAVGGMEFAAAVAAAGTGEPTEEVERRCAALARHGRFLRAGDPVDWPDGTVSAGFGFAHDLHRTVLYDRIPAGRRARLHAAVAGRLERAYGPAAAEHVTELATHFLLGRDDATAVPYLQRGPAGLPPPVPRRAGPDPAPGAAGGGHRDRPRLPDPLGPGGHPGRLGAGRGRGRRRPGRAPGRAGRLPVDRGRAGPPLLPRAPRRRGRLDLARRRRAGRARGGDRAGRDGPPVLLAARAPPAPRRPAGQGRPHRRGRRGLPPGHGDRGQARHPVGGAAGRHRPRRLPDLARPAGALAELRRLYDQFEEGFATPDLVAARTLLDAATRAGGGGPGPR
jgi:hypothetical protein